MIYRKKHHTFLQQLTRMAQRAHKWSIMGFGGMHEHHVITRHTGSAY